jgi:two-component system sensor histidine kinase PilS (NtrC family)
MVTIAVFAAAAFSWTGADPADTLTATLALVVALGWTGVVIALTELRRRPLGRGLAAAQAVVDLLLTAAVVHVTGGGTSQFTGLYILVIAAAALLLPVGWALAAAALACALHASDVIWLRPDLAGAHAAGLGLWLQLGVFATVATGCALIGARLREAGAGGAQLAAALARARVEAADILRNIRSGIVTVDADGRLLYANPAAEQLLGLELAASAGRPVLAAIGRVSPVLARALDDAASLGARTTRAEGTIVRDGQEALVGVTTTVAEQDAEVRAGTAIFSDITESKRLEALHLRAARLEAVAELSASLAHEIRNPLASIRSATESLARLAAAAIAGPLDAEDERDVRTLAALTTRESDRLSRLLAEFLDFARARVTRVERVAVVTAVDDAVRLVRAHPAASGLEVLVAVDDAADAVIDGDPELLHRALVNLVLNAAQASPAGGRVRVDVQLPEPEELPGGLEFADGAVAVHVRDHGPGIAPGLLARLFDPFFTTKPGGSGLGLAVVQRAVEAHRGVVLVEGGGGGVGARFTLLLPRAAGGDAAPTLPTVRPYLPTPQRAVRAVA